MSGSDNPWLHIPACDYEGHMSSPHIAQQQFLAQTFKETIERYDAATIALLGCATGNGLEYIDSAVTQSVTAVDINPEYLEILRQRYQGRVSGLEVVTANLEACELKESTYSLVFAGLILEYVNPRVLLPRIARWLGAKGMLVAVLQLHSEGLPQVSQSRYTSLKALEPIITLVSPQELKSSAQDAGLREIEARMVTLESGKTFLISAFRKM